MAPTMLHRHGSSGVQDSTTRWSVTANHPPHHIRTPGTPLHTVSALAVAGSWSLTRRGGGGLGNHAGIGSFGIPRLAPGPWVRACGAPRPRSPASSKPSARPDPPPPKPPWGPTSVLTAHLNPLRLWGLGRWLGRGWGWGVGPVADLSAEGGGLGGGRGERGMSCIVFDVIDTSAQIPPSDWWQVFGVNIIWF